MPLQECLNTVWKRQLHSLLHAGCRLSVLMLATLLHALLQELAVLTSLRKLELRGHSMLLVLPRFLADLPALRHLDVGCCRHLQLEGVGSLTRLEVLSLQVRVTWRCGCRRFGGRLQREGVGRSARAGGAAAAGEGDMHMWRLLLM